MDNLGMAFDRRRQQRIGVMSVLDVDMCSSLNQLLHHLFVPPKRRHLKRVAVESSLNISRPLQLPTVPLPLLQVQQHWHSIGLTQLPLNLEMLFAMLEMAGRFGANQVRHLGDRESSPRGQPP